MVIESWHDSCQQMTEASVDGVSTGSMTSFPAALPTPIVATHTSVRATPPVPQRFFRWCACPSRRPQPGAQSQPTELQPTES